MRTHWTQWARRVWLPSDLPGAGCVLALRSGIGLIPHATMRPAGTSPPAVTIAGSGRALRVAIDSTAGGTARGQATFKWSEDGGATFKQTGVLTAASVTIGSTGYTVAFPVGTYNTNQTYDAVCGTWKDQSGLGNDATQATQGQCPLIETTAMGNGHTSVLIDPNLSNSLVLPTAFATAFSGTSKPMTLIARCKLIVANRTGPLIGLADTGTADFRLRPQTSASKMGAFRRTDANASTTLATTDADTTNSATYSWVYTGTALSIFLDGVATSVAGAANNLAPGTNACTFSNARIGADGNFAAENAWLAASEIWAFTTGLSAADRASVEAHVLRNAA